MAASHHFLIHSVFFAGIFFFLQQQYVEDCGVKMLSKQNALVDRQCVSISLLLVSADCLMVFMMRGILIITDPHMWLSF